MSTFLDELKSLLGGIDRMPQAYYGKYSRFSMQLSTDGRLQCSIALAIDPNRKMGRVEKGTRVYHDDSSSAFFTLTHNEVYKLYKNMNAILSNTYVNPKANDDKYKNVFTLTHYDQYNKPNYMSFSTQPNEKNKLKVSISKDGSSSAFVFSNTEDTYDLSLFVKFITNVATMSQYQNQVFISYVKILNKALAKIMYNNNTNDSSGNNQYNNQNNRNQYNQRNQSNSQYQNNRQNQQQYKRNEQPQNTNIDDDLPFDGVSNKDFVNDQPSNVEMQNDDVENWINDIDL